MQTNTTNWSLKHNRSHTVTGFAPHSCLERALASCPSILRTNHRHLFWGRIWWRLREMTVHPHELPHIQTRCELQERDTHGLWGTCNYQPCEEHAFRATSICSKGITLQLHAHWLFKRIIYPLTSQEDNPAIIHPPTFHEVWFGRMVSWRGRGWGR